ncbi:MAG: hypothetical protein LBT89_03785 [Planctomycetaceae bacterium]|jgi:DNA modification methylase|nr:hypothetical protein [Planctomycetaceae bacterium]
MKQQRPLTASNKIILGDNLEIMRGMDSESVDLIYLDPPFFSNRNYEVIWGDEGEVRSFKDRWSGGIDHYIAWLKERVEQMHRVLKETGSLFLHCDWHASHYIKVDILDKIFKQRNFRNEIIWKRTNAKGNITKRLGINTDSIFFYSKSAKYTLNLLRGDYSPEQMSRYKQEDEQGLYRCENLTAPGKSRQFVWRGVHPGTNRSWSLSEEKLEELLSQGQILLQQDGRPRKDGLKKYLSEAQGELLDNLWDDIERIANTSKERIGYPTQKPEALMERIIQCASNEGDLVLDPFAGGGTTAIAADRLHRRWIGIDSSVQAVKVTDLRFQQHPEFFSEYTVHLHNYDYETLRYSDAFKFQDWIIEQYGGISNPKKRDEKGVDGWMPDNTPLQVKRGDDIGRNIIDNFLSAAKRHDSKLFEKNKKARKPVGFIIAFSFGKGAIQEAARLKNKENTIVKLITVDKIVPIAQKPKITVTDTVLSRDEKGIREIEFSAVSGSEIGIEFYSWDFSYNGSTFKPDVVRDPAGKVKYKFNSGSHCIAVKVIDNEGLEGFETFHLTLNGTVERT